MVDRLTRNTRLLDIIYFGSPLFQLFLVELRPPSELALATLSSSANPLERDRAAEGILFALRKTWMGELIRALPRLPPGVAPTIGGNPAVRSLLVKISREDFGYRTADWEAWWAKSQARFTDEE